MLDSIHVFHMKEPLQLEVTVRAVGLVRVEPLINVHSLAYLHPTRMSGIGDAVDVAAPRSSTLDHRFTEETIDDVATSLPERMLPRDVLTIHKHPRGVVFGVVTLEAVILLLRTIGLRPVLICQGDRTIQTGVLD